MKVWQLSRQCFSEQKGHSGSVVLVSETESVVWPVAFDFVPLAFDFEFVIKDVILGFPESRCGLKLLDGSFGKIFDIASLLKVGSLATSLFLPINSTKSPKFALLDSLHLMVYICVAHWRCSLSCCCCALVESDVSVSHPRNSNNILK